MKWNVKDAAMYIEAKEYIDTALVPLIPITFNDQMKKLSSASDFISILSIEIEKNFKGRILLTPTFCYLSSDANKLATLQNWEKELRDAQFTHVFFLTSDIDWKKDENVFLASLLWIPAISLEFLEITQAREVIKQQSEQIVDIFIKKWKN
jgi:hypothetical protein